MPVEERVGAPEGDAETMGELLVGTELRRFVPARS
jgi:hypothetical protein